MTDSQLKQDLRALRALYSGPEKWTQGAYARDSKGVSCDSWSREASCWCLSGLPGALLRDGTVDPSRRIACRDAIEKAGPGLSLLAWNDALGRKFEEVTALLDKAIEEAP